MSNFILQKLRISGDIKFLPSEVAFNEGLNIIIGGYKSGKTTLLNLIRLLSKSHRSKADFDELQESEEMELKFYITPGIIDEIKMNPITIKVKKGSISNSMENNKTIDLDNLTKVLYINCDSIQQDSEIDLQSLKKK